MFRTLQLRRISATLVDSRSAGRKADGAKTAPDSGVLFRTGLPARFRAPVKTATSPSQNNIGAFGMRR
jgi:hypothetical protein